LSSPNRSETDAAGAFTLKSRPPAGTLFVAHKAGYAEVPLGRLPSAPVIKLNPWGAVSGTLRIAKAFGTNRTVLLSHRFGPEPQLVFLTLTASTDDSGHFKIAGVPPGQWRLSPHATSIKVKAGETTEVVVGGGGLCVVGRTNPGDAIRRLNEEGYHLTLCSRLFGQASPDPQRFSSVDDYLAAKTAWFRAKLAYLQTEVGREALRDSRDYTPVVQPDGQFIIDEALPGSYELKLQLHPLNDAPPMPLLEEVIQEVEVPEPAEVSSDTLDLGTVDLHLPEVKGLRR
jgi:hypothetical protein